MKISKQFDGIISTNEEYLAEVEKSFTQIVQNI